VAGLPAAASPQKEGHPDRGRPRLAGQPRNRAVLGATVELIAKRQLIRRLAGSDGLSLAKPYEAGTTGAVLRLAEFLTAGALAGAVLGRSSRAVSVLAGGINWCPPLLCGIVTLVVVLAIAGNGPSSGQDLSSISQARGNPPGADVEPVTRVFPDLLQALSLSGRDLLPS
jgi:hypothetical protein